MNVKDFPLCCTAKIISGMGKGRETSSDQYSFGFVYPESVEVIEKYLKEQIKKYERLGLLVVITNNTQNHANKALLNLDFNHSRWISKKQHIDTKDRLWWVETKDWKEPNGSGDNNNRK